MTTEKNKSANLINFNEASVLLGIKESMLRSLVFRKIIPHVKISRLLRFDKSDLEIWIDKRKVKDNSLLNSGKKDV